jgi:hypothetical protein
MPSAIADLNTVIDEMNQCFVAREEDLLLLTRCIVGDCQMLVIGLPVAGKSNRVSA